MIVVKFRSIRAAVSLTTGSIVPAPPAPHLDADDYVETGLAVALFLYLAAMIIIQSLL